jgi:phytoene/squalene synthetase
LSARAVSIQRDIVEPFFTSMRMDLTDRVYTQDSFDTYVYGSAEVVGLMCLAVFIRDAKPDAETARTLYNGARSLGAAFQKVNFLRDLKSDYQERGRVYFPQIDMSNFSAYAKEEIEKEDISDVSKMEAQNDAIHIQHDLKRIFHVGGDDETPYRRGYMDIYDVWEADNNLYLRHYVHDSTD